MEPIPGWGPGGSAAWLRGLSSAVQQYPFEQWHLSGEDLLRLSSQDLENLGVKSIGHQELILEAVEQLCALNYELKTDSLRSLTEKLKKVCMTLCTFILSRRKVSSYDGTAIQRPPADLLTCVIQLVSAARSLFSWLNRYLFTGLNDYSSSRDVISLCGELAEIIHKDTLTVSEKEDHILFICQNISGVCDNILSCSPESLLSQRASLETVQLVSVPPEDSLGIEITSTSFGLHFVSAALAQSPAGHSAKVLPGDEIIQVNGQVVVGWSRMNLVKKLLEKSSGVTLVLKKVTLSSPDQPNSPASPRKQVLSSGSGSPGASHLRYDDSPTGSIIAPLSVIVAEVPEKADSEITVALDYICRTSREKDCTPQQCRGSQTGDSGSSSLQNRDVIAGVQIQGTTAPGSLAGQTPKLSKEPQASATRTNSHPGPEASEQKEESVVNKRKQKGVATRLSRRRVSCRDLGQADFDGWLWKKKENPGFMSQRWKRCWCHLTGNSLYWYNQPNDEKAIGLINVSTYHLESPREPKKKYEFQLSHEKYKPFVFAADSLSDMSMWVTRLITSVTKYTTQTKPHHHKEEDCYSESEADEPEEEVPRRVPEEPKKEELQALTQGQHAPQVAADPGRTESSPQRSPLTTKRPENSTTTTTDPPSDDIESLFKCLTQGGVSLIGKERLLTREQFRKSFAKRNKNPQINERVHEVRTLKSTLKAKMAELQVLDQVLNNPALTSEKFKTWKKDHEELYKELKSLWVQKPGGEKDSNGEESPIKAQEIELLQNMGIPMGSAQETESLPKRVHPQELGSQQEMWNPQEIKSPRGIGSPQEMWSPLDMGSPLEMGNLMGSLQEIGGLQEKGRPCETWSPPERGSPQERGSMRVKGSTQERSVNEMRSTRERCFSETGSTQEGSFNETRSTREKGNTQEICFSETGSTREGSFGEKRSTWEKGSTRERSFSETGSTWEGSFNETRSTREKGNTQERCFSETGSTREGSFGEKRSTREKGSTRERSFNETRSTREKGSTRERSFNETGSTRERSCNEEGNTRERSCNETGSTRERSCNEEGSTRERRSPRNRDSHKKRGSPLDSERVPESKSTPEMSHRERGSAYETVSDRENGSYRESGSRGASKSSQGRESLRKMGSPQEEHGVQDQGSPREGRNAEGRECAWKKGSPREGGSAREKGAPRERRSSEGRRSPRETESIQQEKNSPDSGQDKKRKGASSRERQLFLCI